MCQNRIRAGFLHLRTTLKLTVLSLNNKKAIFFAAAVVMVVLTLLEPGGGAHCAPPVVFDYNRAITCTSMLKKLDFSQL